MKKTLSILFSLTMLSCLCTGCGNSDENTSSNGNAAEKPTMATDETSGLNSATDASEAAAGDDGMMNDRESSVNATDKNITTDTGGVVDDLVSSGEQIIDDAGSAVEGIVDDVTGTENTTR
jgi:PBP1b-binding outer membrane lipoprotein LpoB